MHGKWRPPSKLSGVLSSENHSSSNHAAKAALTSSQMLFSSSNQTQPDETDVRIVIHMDPSKLPSIMTPNLAAPDLAYSMTAHFSRLEAPSRPVYAAMRVGHRSQPQIKDTAWVMEGHKLFQKTIDSQYDINEVISRQHMKASSKFLFGFLVRLLW